MCLDVTRTKSRNTCDCHVSSNPSNSSASWQHRTSAAATRPAIDARAAARTPPRPARLAPRFPSFHYRLARLKLKLRWKNALVQKKLTMSHDYVSD